MLSKTKETMILKMMMVIKMKMKITFQGREGLYVIYCNLLSILLILSIGLGIITNLVQ